MMKVGLVLLTLMCLCPESNTRVSAVGWNAINNPTRFLRQLSSLGNGAGGGGAEFVLSSLPMSGRSPQVPWSDTYWPNKYGGIAQRWYMGGAGSARAFQQGFNYALHPLPALKAMSIDQLKLLSPAEKFDIFNARYDYPTVRSEWARCKPNDAEWEGVCHGWAPASYAFKQPSPVVLKNPDGLSVPFGSSDIKALLIYFTAQYSNKGFLQPGDAQVGSRCRFDIKRNVAVANIPECQDLNAGSFHVILANVLGRQSRVVVIDRDRSIPVWNQPVLAFETKWVPIPAAADVRTRITYSKEAAPSWEPIPAVLVMEDYHYKLDLQDGRIVGGDYLQWERPDFIWSQQIPAFFGYFAALKTIYEASVAGPGAGITAGVPSSTPIYRSPMNTEESYFERAFNADLDTDEDLEESDFTNLESPHMHLLPSDFVFNSVNVTESPYLQDLVPTPPIESFSNHYELTTPSGYFAFQRKPAVSPDSNSLQDDQQQPPLPERASWSIVPDTNCGNGITITFTNLNIRRVEDEVKVYEGQNCDGAMVASLHGHDPIAPSSSSLRAVPSEPSSPPPSSAEIHVATNSACVIFISQPRLVSPLNSPNIAFEASYTTE